MFSFSLLLFIYFLILFYSAYFIFTSFQYFFSLNFLFTIFRHQRNVYQRINLNLIWILSWQTKQILPNPSLSLITASDTVTSNRAGCLSPTHDVWITYRKSNFIRVYYLTLVCVWGGGGKNELRKLTENKIKKNPKIYLSEPYFASVLLYSLSVNI